MEPTASALPLTTASRRFLPETLGRVKGVSSVLSSTAITRSALRSWPGLPVNQPNVGGLSQQVRSRVSRSRLLKSYRPLGDSRLPRALLHRRHARRQRPQPMTPGTIQARPLRKRLAQTAQLAIPLGGVVRHEIKPAGLALPPGQPLP